MLSEKAGDFRGHRTGPPLAERPSEIDGGR
jgi:hypothetical protein